MKNILLPTDFSDNAKNAFQFVQAFLPPTANLKVLHSYRPTIDANYANLEQSSEVLFEQQKKQLSQFVSDSMSSQMRSEKKLGATTSTIEMEVAIGFPTDVIVEASKKEIDLIIMGGTGMTNALDRTFGSIASHVAQNAHCPVLIIPKNARFTGFHDILFASHHESVKPKLLQKTIDFAKKFGSKLHFIHVQEAKENLTLNEELEDNLFQFIFEKGTPTFEFNLASIDANSTVEGLNKYIAENNIDLAFLVTHHRNFWERLFHSSVTKKMTIHTSIPMLILHDD